MSKPNIIYIYADDLGRGLLSCYGQKLIETPNIDRIAHGGMRFDRFYATAFCAPARASLICGIHDAHSGGWTYTPGAYYKKISSGELSYDEVQEVLQHTGIEARGGEDFLGTVAQKAGYVTGEIGKLEWGFSTTAERVRSHGWDYHYGYYDHIRCHGFYPPFLFENGEKIDIPGNTDPHCGRPEYYARGKTDPYETKHNLEGREVYSQDLFDEKIREFLRANREKPFFLFHPSQLPHGPVFYPEHHPKVKGRDDLIDIEKEYASMILRLDDTVGMILDELETLGLTDNTLVIFASDNGHTNSDYGCPGRTENKVSRDGRRVNDIDNPFRTKSCGDTFNGNDGMAGLKFSNWDGGNKIAFLAQWPGVIPAGSVSDKLLSNYDTLATVAEVVGRPVPENTDGLSYLSALRGDENAAEHDYVVFSSKAGPALVTADGWKLRVHMGDDVIGEVAVSRCNAALDDRTILQLYRVTEDYAEENDLAGQFPNKVEELRRILVKECDGSFLNGTPMAHTAQPDYPVPVWKEILENRI